MQQLKYIEPGLKGYGAELRIRNFYYSNTLSFSVSKEIKKDASHVKDDCVLFYFIHEGVLLEKIQLPIDSLIKYEEVWVRRQNEVEEALLFATNTFKQYSYYLLQPF